MEAVRHTRVSPAPSPLLRCVRSALAAERAAARSESPDPRCSCVCHVLNNELSIPSFHSDFQSTVRLFLEIS